MAKDINKQIENQIATNHEPKQNGSSFAASNVDAKTVDIYKYLYQTVREIKYLGPRFSNETFINLTKNLIDTNIALTNEYIYKYNVAANNINELYNAYLKTIGNHGQNLKANLEELQKDTDKQIKDISNNLLQFQQDAISRYKLVENSYLPKSNFLTNNKKVNKEEYIKIITDINQKRIISNQQYQFIANDLSSKNEQQQFKLKHAVDSSIEKNQYDKQIIDEDIEQKIADIKVSLEEKEKENTNIINKKHRSITENTIQTNENITTLSTEYLNRQRHSDIPFNINESNYLDKLEENVEKYAKLENKVLDEFKTLLQQNDAEIDSFRQTHRLYEEMQIAKLKQTKKEYETKITKEMKLYGKEIAALGKSEGKVDKVKIKELINQRESSVANVKKEYLKTIEPIKKAFLEQQLEYIAQNEKLRIRKSECEAIKSSAIKNLNYERHYNHERINAELKLNANEKDVLSVKDKHDEYKAIYEYHLKDDVEKENIRFEINEKELDTYKEKINSLYQIDKLLLEKKYRCDLSDADLDYQKETIKSRTNFHNVTTMLEIQKEQLISEFETMFANEKMNFEQIKNNFYNNCDNIQYELYQTDNEKKYKEIDIDLKFKQDLAEHEIQHKKTLLNYERRALNNENEYRENLENIALYENRLTIEKELLNNTFDLFMNSLRNVIDLDDYIHTNLDSISKSCFEDTKEQIILCIEHLRKIKLSLVNDYYNNEVNILKARIDFEKDIKFKKIYENTRKEWNNFSAFSKSKRDKIAQTIISYRNTLETSKKALIEKVDEQRKLKRKLYIALFQKKKTSVVIGNIRKEIKTNKEYIALIKRQISANKENIKKQRLLEKDQIKKIKKTDRKYNKIYVEIEKNQNAEARVYNDSLSLIQQQYNKIKADIIRTGSLLSSNKYTYANLGKNKVSINEQNSKLIITIKSFFAIHYNKLTYDLHKRYNILKNDYQLNYKSLFKEKTNLVDIENKANTTTIHTIENEHKSAIETLEREFNIAKNKLNNGLKKLSSNHETNLMNFNKKMIKLEDSKKYEIKCHDENFKMYVSKFNDKNAKVVKLYLQKIDAIKLQYTKDTLSLEEKNKNNLKNIRNQHISNENLRKNNISDLNNDFKEQIKKIDLKIKNIETSRKEYKNAFEEQKNKEYNLYLQYQENTRKEFDGQMKQITNKCESRIKVLQKNFKREFKNKNGIAKI